MAGIWRMIDDILDGADAIRAARERYLPRYQAESDDEYARRLASSPWRPEFRDSLRGLASKPFSHDVTVDDTAPEAVIGVMDAATKTRRGGLVDNIDARGNNLTAFSRVFFEGAIAKGMRGILVDYPPVAEGASLDDIRRAGVRPYWVDVRAEDIIALYTAVIAGVETVVHLRIRECSVERDGYSEVMVERVREFDRPRIEMEDGSVTWGPTEWRLWRLVPGEGSGDTASWAMESEGLVRRGNKTDIPFAILWTGERRGSQEVRPPLLDIAHMQLELYRSMSRKEEILTYAGSPMLSANGMERPDDGAPMAVGPKAILYAPPGVDGGQTSWSYVQPDPNNVKEVREDISGIIDDMRRLGMQPLTPRSGNVTATSTSVEAAKAHSQVEAWALALKDTLEQAFVYTAEWLGIGDTIRVSVDTDFAVQPYAQAPLDALDKARARKDISQRTYWDCLRRFDVLPPDFDAAEEEVALADEMAGLEPEDVIDPISGSGIDPGQAAA